MTIPNQRQDRHDVITFFGAVEAGDLERVRSMLIAHPELVHARDVDGATPLHIAAFWGHRRLVALLCDSGANVNARDERFDATPSGWAIHYLRERGGLLAIEIEDVLYAIQRRDAPWVRRLVKRHPALRTATDTIGKSLAEHAREAGDPEILRWFTS